MGSSAGLPGFRRGITVACFHSVGTKAFLRSVSNRCLRQSWFSAERFFTIRLSTRSMPTALLFDFGRHFVISSADMGSLCMLGVGEEILSFIVASKCALSRMFDGFAQLNCCKNNSVFSVRELMALPFSFIVTPSGELLMPFPAMHLTKDQSLGWS